MHLHELHRELWLPRPLHEVFSFFADPQNLEVITPPWLNFRILNPHRIKMHPGTLIDYRLRVRGIPMRWQSEITEWKPPHRFIDVQRRGPYRLWHHEHTFEQDDNGTLCRDVVRYAVPFDWLTHRLFVRPDIEAIFDFRGQKMRELFTVV